jgi:hypothetical protein
MSALSSALRPLKLPGGRTALLGFPEKGPAADRAVATLINATLTRTRPARRRATAMFGRGGACAVGVENASATSAQLRQSVPV